MPGWIAMTVNMDELDLIRPAISPRQPDLNTVPALLDGLGQSVAQRARRGRRPRTTTCLTPWRLLSGGRVVYEQPRYVVIHDSVFNHLAHHRGQLTVYLRLKGALVPAISGPTADEPL
ncbi:MAG TPA: DinB family protein [Bryobacteraceae bacterium]|nr:DinB family protein [Bryobacteraceae bacterium]